MNKITKRSPSARLKTKCEQLTSFLRKELETRYRPGDKLAPEAEWAVRLGVNKITLCKALLQLKYEGYIMRNTGVGTVVCARPLRVRQLITGVLFSDAAMTDDPYYRALFGAMSRQAIIRGWMHGVMNVGDDTRQAVDEARLEAVLCRPDVTGVLVAVLDLRNCDHLTRYRACRPPIVWVGARVDDPALNWVDVDVYGITRALLEWAGAKGWRRIFLISRELNSAHRRERHRAFVERHAAEMAFVGGPGVSARDAGYAGMRQLLQSGHLPDCLLAADCRTADGIRRATAEWPTPVRVPVLTYDYDFSGALPEVVASAIQPLDRMVAAAIEFFDNPREPLQRLFEGQIITGCAATQPPNTGEPSSG